MRERIWALIPEDELEYSFFRSSGPGGQKKNTTDSAVRLRHLPTGLVVVATASRSQHRNKATALEVLEARLLDRRWRPKRRVETRPSRGVRRRRVEDKRRQGMKKASRRVRDDD